MSATLLETLAILNWQMPSWIFKSHVIIYWWTLYHLMQIHFNSNLRNVPFATMLWFSGLSKVHFTCMRACKLRSLAHDVLFQPESAQLVLHVCVSGCTQAACLLSIFSHVLGGFSLEGRTIMWMEVCESAGFNLNQRLHLLIPLISTPSSGNHLQWSHLLRWKPADCWLMANTGHDCPSQVVWLVQSRL